LEQQKVVHRRAPQLGHRSLRISFQVPANRLGYETLSLAQLKVLQEIITLSVFAPFALLYMHQPIKLDYLWSGLCLAGAAYFMFRS
jgi:hypothetical protein